MIVHMNIYPPIFCYLLNIQEEGFEKLYSLGFMSLKVYNAKSAVFFYSQEKKQKLDIAHYRVRSSGGTGIFTHWHCSAGTQ